MVVVVVVVENNKQKCKRNKTKMFVFLPMWTIDVCTGRAVEELNEINKRI